MKARPGLPCQSHGRLKNQRQKHARKQEGIFGLQNEQQQWHRRHRRRVERRPIGQMCFAGERGDGVMPHHQTPEDAPALVCWRCRLHPPETQGAEQRCHHRQRLRAQRVQSEIGRLVPQTRAQSASKRLLRQRSLDRLSLARQQQRRGAAGRTALLLGHSAVACQVRVTTGWAVCVGRLTGMPRSSMKFNFATTKK